LLGLYKGFQVFLGERSEVGLSVALEKNKEFANWAEGTL
jgi:hypothetical protein